MTIRDMMGAGLPAGRGAPTVSASHKDAAQTPRAARTPPGTCSVGGGALSAFQLFHNYRRRKKCKVGGNSSDWEQMKACAVRAADTQTRTVDGVMPCVWSGRTGTLSSPAPPHYVCVENGCVALISQLISHRVRSTGGNIALVRRAQE